MSQIFDFFLAPYQEASWFDISLELFAALFGIASVWFAKKEKIWVYPTGIISTILYIYICYKFILYGDMIINIYYSLMSVYGWYMWTRVTNDNVLEISRTNRIDKLKAVGIFFSTAIFVVFVYMKYDVINTKLGPSETFDYIAGNLGSLEVLKNITPYMDVITTGVFFAGMWLMANKKIENWILWIVGNIISVPLYFVKGLGFTAIQFTIFLILAIFGYIAWKKSLDNKHQIA